MQQISDQPVIVLDVAHVYHSAEYFAQQVTQKYAGKNLHVVVAMLHDKDIPATLEVLAPVATHWYPASPARGHAAQQQLNYVKASHWACRAAFKPCSSV